MAGLLSPPHLPDSSMALVMGGESMAHSDPADAAARQEMLERLSQALERLEEKKQALWKALGAGKKLRQIACEQGISYDAVKRLLYPR